MKRCIYLDELKKDNKKVCRLFIDWKEEYSGECMVVDNQDRYKDRYCMCEMWEEDKD